jgi:hypothetical protein
MFGMREVCKKPNIKTMITRIQKIHGFNEQGITKPNLVPKEL